MAKFAEELGISTGYVSMLEAGKNQPSPLLLKALSWRFSVSEHWLRTGQGPMAEEDRAPAREGEPSDPRLAELVRELSAWWAAANDEDRAFLRGLLRRLMKER